MGWQNKSLVAFAVAILFAACSPAEDGQTTEPRPVSGFVPSTAGTLSGASRVAGAGGTGVAGSTSSRGPVGSGGMGMPTAGTVAGTLAPPRAGQQGAAGMSPTVTPPAGGMSAPTAGMGMAGMGMAGMGTPPQPAPPGAMSPKIPELSEQCPEFKDQTITFMGLGGIAMVAGPKAAGPTAPMVFYWHGTGSTSGEYIGSAMATHQGVIAEGGVLISFQGSKGGDLLSGTSVFGMGDFLVTDQLVACAVKNHNVDPRRIYTTGCSAGGLFAAAMATLRSSYVAAAAPNSGGWVTQLRFQDMHAPALMTMHGAPGGDVVFVDFSQTSATADKAFKAAGGFVINCNHGGSHCGARALAGDVWKFFKAHPFGAKPSPWANGLPPDFSSVCKIY